jgi:3-phosphoglycerate kinase
MPSKEAVVLENVRLEHKETDCDADVAHESLEILTSLI